MAQVNNGILDDEDQGDVIGEYTPDVIVTEFVGFLPLLLECYCSHCSH